ncbi:uncharacterized protein [Rhodnius prolixus]|uniref:uncharacterized protein n=1 Tax=Rhodnius prolixus TaxID=13249 RepID=UPI003D18E11A
MYAKIESVRLLYMRLNQVKLRSEEYIHLRDAVVNDGNLSELEKMVILPSTFTGSPRHMHEYAQDAMTYVRAYGRPDFFITYTCNPAWDEIKELLLTGQSPSDRHDISACVFKQKLKSLIGYIVKHHVFGETRCWMYFIEWQKRGLPHAHILIWTMEKITPNRIDEILSAEIPDIEIDKDLHDIVSKNIIHGPSGSLSNNSPCMSDGKCTKRYPRDLLAETITGNDGYSLYRRRSTEDANKSLTELEMIAPNRSGNDIFDRDIQRETHFDVHELQTFVRINLPKLVSEQRTAYDTIITVISNKSCATLLDGGRTAHSALKLPLNMQVIETPTCNISKYSGLGKLLRSCQLIIWDECTMAHKKSLEALDRTLQDLRGNVQLFGGALILLAGDFRQTLPVLPRSTPADELNACLKSSVLWRYVEKISLKTNMRVQLQQDESSERFAKQLLDSGNGKMEMTNPHTVLQYQKTFVTIVLSYCTEEGPRTRSITAGVAQGSILGPDLWNVPYDSLLRLELPEEAMLIGYADDVAALIAARNVNKAQLKFNQVMRKANRWMTAHGLTLALPKTEVAMLTKKNE